MIKAEFSASFLQSSVSHDPSEIILICWLAAQETFLIINVENSCSASYIFVETITLFFRILWWIESSKEQNLFEIFGNNVKIFVTFDQINASLLNNQLIYFLSFILNHTFPRTLIYSVLTCLLWSCCLICLNNANVCSC